MRHFFYTVLLICFVGSTQGQCDPNSFKTLIRYSKKTSLTEDEWHKALSLVKELQRNKCHDYEVKKGNQIYAESSLTYLFGKICCNNKKTEAVRQYMIYLNENLGSAEEQLDYSFENLIVAQPENVLPEIAKNNHDKQMEYLGRWAWGFVNNRYYGANDPYGNDPNKAFNVDFDAPKPRLTTKNYKDMFWTVNSKVKKMYPTYKWQIDSLLPIIKGTLEELYPEKKSK